MAECTLENLPLIDCIPDAEAVRSRLAQLTREEAILRKLLKVSEEKEQAAERERLQRPQGGCDGR
jgi:hypothetical protein